MGADQLGLNTYVNTCIREYLHTDTSPSSTPSYSGEAVLMILQKDNAIKAWREFMGPTNSLTVPIS